MKNIPIIHKLEFFPVQYIKLFVFSALVLFAITGACMIYWTITNAFNSKKITDAQIRVYNAQAEQQGKPTTIIQEYRSPMK